jgi:hypothetical protein
MNPNQNAFEVVDGTPAFKVPRVKFLAAAAAIVAIAVAGFLLGCIFTEHWMLGIGFGKTVNAFCHGMDDRFRF